MEAARRKLRSSATATKARRRYELPTTSFISGQGRANRGALGEPNTDAGAGNVSFSLKPGKYAQAQAEHPLNREESLPGRTRSTRRAGDARAARHRDLVQLALRFLEHPRKDKSACRMQFDAPVKLWIVREHA